MKLFIFLRKKVDSNCDPFPILTEFNYYVLGNFNLPKYPVILNSSEYGFFSNFIGVLGYLDFCEKNGYKPDIRFTTGCYLDKDLGSNWYLYYFEHTAESSKDSISYTDQYQDNTYLDTLPFSNYARSFLTLQHKNYLFNKYVKIKDSISEYVSYFIENEFNGFFVVGCHIRGTDKVIESKFVNSENIFFEEIDRKIKNREKYKIFLATDDTGYFLKFKKKYGDKLIYINHFKSDKEAVHLNKNNQGYEIGRQVLVDSLVLSKCDYFIGSRSNVSHAVIIFNPDIDYKIIKKGIKYKNFFIKILCICDNILKSKFPKIYKLLKPYFPDKK